MSLHDLFWNAIFHVPRHVWRSITWWGDSGLMLPAGLLITLWLASSRRTWPTAALWVLLFGTAGFIIVVTKLAFLGWGIGSAQYNFTGISGHTAISACIWPVALWLIGSRAGHWPRVLLAFCGWLLAVVIGISRLALHAHSPVEVASGLLLGSVVSGVFLLVQHRMPHPVLRASLVVISLLAPLLVHRPGMAAPTQGLLEGIAVRIAGIDKPYTREDLLRR